MNITTLVRIGHMIATEEEDATGVTSKYVKMTLVKIEIKNLEFKK